MSLSNYDQWKLASSDPAGCPPSRRGQLRRSAGLSPNERIAMHKTTEIEQLRFAVEDVVENLKELKAFVLRGLGELRAEISALNFNGVLGANEFMRQAASIQRQIDSYGGTLSRIENVAEATIKLFEALDAALGTTPPSKIQG